MSNVPATVAFSPKNLNRKLAVDSAAPLFFISSLYAEPMVKRNR